MTTGTWNFYLLFILAINWQDIFKKYFGFPCVIVRYLKLLTFYDFYAITYIIENIIQGAL